MAVATASERRRNRTKWIAEFRLLYPFLPKSLAKVYADAYITYGDSDLAWQEVRNGDGAEAYDAAFPGNRRENGTTRLSEPDYLSTFAQYRNTLAQRGLNPSVFESRLVELMNNEVGADEFESRVAAVSENIAQQGEDIRRAFAEASGVVDFSPEAVLATVLDPEGIGRELLDRRISIAQVRGTAAQFGVQRSQERIESVLAQVDVDRLRAQEFYSTAESQVKRLNTISSSVGRGRSVDINQLEDASLLREQEDIDRLTRLMGRERSQFGSRRGQVQQDQQGRQSGLGA